MSYIYNKRQQNINIARVCRENNKIGLEFINLVNEKGFEGAVKTIEKILFLACGQDFDL